MSDPEESQPTPNHNEPRAPITPDYSSRLSKIESDIAKILGIIEPPHLEEIARKEQEAEATRKLAETIASGDFDVISG